MMALPRVAQVSPGLVLRNRDSDVSRPARRRRAILERAGPGLGSGLGKIGRAAGQRVARGS